jgi:4-amino-4-deoxychorismate lyase
MSRLFESIRIQNGRRYLLEYHSRRFNQSRKAIFGIDDPIDLKKQIKVPDKCKQGLFKCRIVYDEKIRSITFDPYNSNIVRTLRIVHDETINYEYKYIERKNIDQLNKLRSGCDDILIVRNGLITDTSICNIIFLKGGKWVTPKVSLFRGVQRQQLLDKGIIKEANITLQQLSNFTHFKLINAMKPFSSATIIPIDNIRF